MGSWVSVVNIMMLVMSKAPSLSISLSTALNLPSVTWCDTAVDIYCILHINTTAIHVFFPIQGKENVALASRNLLYKLFKYLCHKISNSNPLDRDTQFWLSMTLHALRNIRAQRRDVKQHSYDDRCYVLWWIGEFAFLYQESQTPQIRT